MRLYDGNYSTGDICFSYELEPGAVGSLDLVLKIDGQKDRTLYTRAVHSPPLPKETTKPCVRCGKELTSLYDNWESLQPLDGFGANLTCGFGSRHDELDFEIVLCDDCIEELR